MAKQRGSRLIDLPPALNPEQRLTLAQAMVLTGRGRSKFYADVKSGKLPPPERDGARFVRWRAGDLIGALSTARAR